MPAGGLRETGHAATAGRARVHDRRAGTAPGAAHRIRSGRDAAAGTIESDAAAATAPAHQPSQSKLNPSRCSGDLCPSRRQNPSKITSPNPPLAPVAEVGLVGHVIRVLSAIAGLVDCDALQMQGGRISALRARRTGGNRLRQLKTLLPSVNRCCLQDMRGYLQLHFAWHPDCFIVW